MTQDEKWLKKYQKVMMFIETNHRNLSRHNLEERGLLKQNREMLHAGKMKEERGLCGATESRKYGTESVNS